MKDFIKVLANTALANITANFLWWALTFWIYLETKSVLATAIVGGLYMLLIAVLGVPFGLIVDRMKKKRVMQISATITAVTYGLAAVMCLLLPEDALSNLGGVWFWLFAGVILIGGVVEQLRNIALSTVVTLMVEPDKRANANGMVGTVHGITFMLTSVFSGLAIGFIGMKGATFVAFGLSVLCLVHLATVAIPEEGVEHVEGTVPEVPSFKSVWPAVVAVSGLIALILFTTFNNLIGGVFMALMDPYGLELFDVKAWGIVLAFTSSGFILGGAIVAKWGLGKNPVRTLLWLCVGISLIGIIFVIREHWWLFAVGMLVFMALMPMAEAAEQTVIQRVVPFEKQGRVFGFASMVEASAAPISAFIIGPIAEFKIIPYMRTPEGQEHWGWLLGDGNARGIALVFILASLVQLVAVAVAFMSKSYRTLSRSYAEAEPSPTGGATDAAASETA